MCLVMGLAMAGPSASVVELGACFWVVVGALLSAVRFLGARKLLPVSRDLLPVMFALAPCADSLVEVVSRDWVAWACGTVDGLAVKWDIGGLPSAVVSLVELVRPVEVFSEDLKPPDVEVGKVFEVSSSLLEVVAPVFKLQLEVRLPEDVRLDIVALVFVLDGVRRLEVDG